MKTRIPSPTSHVRYGHARADITPPVGIYHRLWGAARHDRSTGVHRPLFADVMVLGPVDGPGVSLIRAQLDLCGLVRDQHEDLTRALSEAGGVSPDRVVLTYSHTHSSGWFVPDRFEFPGGELILPYLKDLGAKLQDACPRAVANVQEAYITYASGRCDMAANRDGYDEEFGRHVCGFNPDAPADETVIVGRITAPSGDLLGALVHYACHPTTLAWENTLISPDYVGAMREEVERAIGAPCLFLQGACGDLGPKEGFVGDVAVADRNGRQLAHAALSALASLGPPGTDFAYRGPVISGATLGTWARVPFTDERLKQASRFSGGTFSVDLPLKPRPDRASLQADLEQWEARQREADAAGDAVAARDYGARAERARRWLARLTDLPDGPTCPVQFSVHRLGDAAWVTSGGEPYNALQVELRRRFPALILLFSPLASGLQVAYLLPADRYGKGLYQEEPSPLAPGCLEALTEAIAEKIEEIAR
ncbi:neutral/alkaline non-lysosomal ceramidase N-terminal domain-containing protein [bacterium]|nr:neutral/alkaline non-lysosomal ceramidase N-terminal domain-containing protein [bacterium]